MNSLLSFRALFVDRPAISREENGCQIPILAGI